MIWCWRGSPGCREHDNDTKWAHDEPPTGRSIHPVAPPRFDLFYRTGGRRIRRSEICASRAWRLRDCAVRRIDIRNWLCVGDVSHNHPNRTKNQGAFKLSEFDVLCWGFHCFFCMGSWRLVSRVVRRCASTEAARRLLRFAPAAEDDMKMIRIACLAMTLFVSSVLHAQTIQFKGKIYWAVTVEDCSNQTTSTNGTHCVRFADNIYTIEALKSQDGESAALASGDSVYVRVKGRRMSVVKKGKVNQYKVVNVWMDEADVPYPK
jgi:hypothetical protein